LDDGGNLSAGVLYIHCVYQELGLGHVLDLDLDLFSMTNVFYHLCMGMGMITTTAMILPRRMYGSVGVGVPKMIPTLRGGGLGGGVMGEGRWVRGLSKVRVSAKKHRYDDMDGGGLMAPGRNMAPKYVPRGVNQEAYVDALNDPEVPVVFVTGPAGCGKTLFACATAIQALKRGDISRIIFTRPVVPAEEDIGFLPGNILRKMDPWLQPLFDVFLEYYTQKEIDGMIAGGVIEISPLGFMRGRTFKRAFIIADEMQNSSPNQMLMLLTRVGMGSKIVVTGDLRQSDLSYRLNSLGCADTTVTNGLEDFIDKLRKYEEMLAKNDGEGKGGRLGDIRLIEMTANDVERSPVVKRILEIAEM
jgi:phosphate starvation-inducible PhoH-like protein